MHRPATFAALLVFSAGAAHRRLYRDRRRLQRAPVRSPAQMAVEDFGGKVLGKPITVISTDHQITSTFRSRR